MNSELYKLLMTYEGLDDDFINQAFEIIMADEEGLEPFVRDFVITDAIKGSLGSYSNDERKILINRENILTGRAQIKNKKMLALQVLRHEIEHARNLQRIYECRNDIESRVLKYSLKDYAVRHHLDSPDPFDRVDYNSFYFRLKRVENYDFDPGERIAEIKAWKYIVNLLKNQRRTEDLLVARSELFYAYARGYYSNGWYLNPPTYEFLLRMGMYHEHYLLKKRVEEEQYVFDTRLMFGLPLEDKKEYDKMILQKVRLQKSKRQ